MNYVLARTLGNLMERCGRVANYGTSFVLCAAMSFWLLMTAWTGAEVLDVLVLEVDILVERKGNTTTSIPQPKNKAKEHQLQVVVFSAD